MSDNSLGTPEQLRDPNYMPPLGQAVPLGIQHVLAMFASNVTPAIIVCGAAGIGFGSDQGALGFPDMRYMIQMSMLFAGIATLIQTLGVGPVGAKLPIVQGTSFAFLPVMIPAVAGLGAGGLGGLMAGVMIGGVFHMILGTFIKKIRFALPPLVTGLIVLMIGLALVKVGIQYAAGGVPLMGKPAFGSLAMWFPALIVIIVTLAVKFFGKGITAVAAVLVGIIAGYIVALFMGQVNFGGVGGAAFFELPNPFRWGFSLNWAIIIGMCLMAFISAIETVGDVSGITKGGAGREATDEEIQGATYADGLGTAIAGIFGGLPNTSFSQNVGLISMTGVMSRHVVSIGACFLIIGGLIPKVGAIINTVPINVLGGGVIVMFGMVCSAGVNMLSDVNWNRRNMVIFATALSVGLGLQLVPDALQHMPGTLKILLTSGLLPAAAIAIVLNLLLPEDLDGDDGNSGAHETQISGLGDAGSASSGAGSGTTSASTAASLASSGTISTRSSSSEPDAGSAGGSTSKSAGKSGGAGSSSPAAKKSGGASSAANRPSPAKKSASKSASKSVSKAAGKSSSKSPRATSKSSAAKSAAKPAAQKTAAKSASKSAAKSAPTKAAPKSAGKAGKSGVKDDIALIDGVGPVLSKKLTKLGYGTLSSIAKASIADLTKAADVVSYAEKSGKYAKDWQKQAKDLLAGKPARAKSDRARQKAAKS